MSRNAKMNEKARTTFLCCIKAFGLKKKSLYSPFNLFHLSSITMAPKEWKSVVGSLLHPTLVVPNIMNFIKITFDFQTGQYITWSTFFKIHARIYEVLDPTIPPANLAESSLKTFISKIIFKRHWSWLLVSNWCICAPMDIWYYIQWSP